MLLFERTTVCGHFDDHHSPTAPDPPISSSEAQKSHRSEPAHGLRELISKFVHESLKDSSPKAAFEQAQSNRIYDLRVGPDASRST